MSFWVASADASGALIASSAELLSPGPSEVDYPMEPAGRIVDTSAGTRIKQQPPKDPRPRAWVWEMLPTYRAGYVRLVQRLEGLLGTTRQARGLSPWIYLKEDQTDEFRLIAYESGTVSAATSSTLSDSGKSWTTNAFTNGVVEIVTGTGTGQRKSIFSNTTTQLTVDTWDVQPTAGSTYSIQYSNPTWVRVRVLNVAKKPMARRSITFEGLRIDFVVDDDNWNAFG